MKEKTNRSVHYLLALLVIAAGVIFDQWTKILAVKHLKDQDPFVIWENVFELHYLENRGAAFGMLQDQRIVFYFSVIIVTAFLVYFYLKVPMTKKYLPLRISAVFIAAGAYGNFIDRVKLNYVVDFFYFKLIDFPIFNVADIYVTVTVFVLVFLILFYYKEEDLDRIFTCRK